MTAKLFPFPSDDQREFERRIADCDEQANSYFVKATPRQHAEFAATMDALRGTVGPKWRRARDAAKAKFHADTAEARALCDRTFDCLMQTGEVSETLSEEWDALVKLEAVSHAVAAE